MASEIFITEFTNVVDVRTNLIDNTYSTINAALTTNILGVDVEANIQSLNVISDTDIGGTLDVTGAATIFCVITKYDSVNEVLISTINTISCVRGTDTGKLGLTATLELGFIQFNLTSEGSSTPSNYFVARFMTSTEMTQYVAPVV